MKFNAIKHAVCLLSTLMLFMVPVCQAATGTVDREYVFNPEELKAALDEATSPFSQRITDSQLFEKFDTVNQLLKEKDIDKQKLLDALNGLQSEMTEFTQDWGEVTEPLWAGQDAIGKTIDKVRGLLARSAKGEPTAKAKESLKRYDKRLSDMAAAIKNEVNEERRKRLKQVFANVLSLRQLTEQAGMIDLGPAQQSVYVKIIDSLSNLEMALTNSTFEVEKVRIVLEGQSDFINTYSEILGGVIEAELLATMLNKMSGAGQGIGGLGVAVESFNNKIGEFTDSMGPIMQRLTSSIDTQTADIVQVSDYNEEDLDRQIEAYLPK